MHILKTNINKNPNIGLYGYCTDSYCLLGKTVQKKLAQKIGKILKVPVHQITIGKTSLIGALCTGNNNCLLLPNIIEDNELKVIEKLNIEYKIIDTKLTAFGNNILCNDNGCLVNPDFSAKTKKEIRTALNVPLNPGMIADIEVVGACCAHNSKGVVIHSCATEENIAQVKKLLKLKPIRATVNFGSPYVKAGILTNSNGIIIGEATTGVEAVTIDEALGFL